MNDNKNVNTLENDVDVEVVKKPNVLTKAGEWVDNFSWKRFLAKVGIFVGGAVVGTACCKLLSNDDDSEIEVTNEFIIDGEAKDVTEEVI